MGPSLKVRNYSIIVLLACLWGSSFILVEQGLKVFSPLQVGAFRVFFAFITLFPFWFVYPAKGFDRKTIGYLLVVALLGSGIPPFLFALAQTEIASSLAGILNSLTPLFTLLIGAWFFQTPSTPKKMIGVVVGFVGACSLILVNADGGFQSNFMYALLVVVATIFYGIGANTLKRYLTHLKPIMITTVAFTMIGPVAIVILLLSGTIETIQTNEGAYEAMAYLFFLGAVGTAFALVIFNYLIQTTSALSASMVTYLIPLVAMGWGIFADEPLGWVHLVGLLTILIGIFLTNREEVKSS